MDCLASCLQAAAGNLVRSGAIWCDLVRSGAIWCDLVRSPKRHPVADGELHQPL
ncbi:MAG: hypothetical protein SNJ57_16005 [Cyanobacteriota bacterium]